MEDDGPGVLLFDEEAVGNLASTGSGVRLESDRLTDSRTCLSWILSSLRRRFRWTAALRGMVDDSDDVAIRGK